MRQTTTCALLLLLTAACGPTVGDPCTTNTECLGQSCLNTDYAPGGYCTLACNLNDATVCPSGTLCIADALGKGNAACMRTCRSAAECRTGYVCRTQKNSSAPVCVGPNGI